MWVVLLPSFLLPVGKQSQLLLLLQPTEVELGQPVGVEFDKKMGEMQLKEGQEENGDQRMVSKHP